MLLTCGPTKVVGAPGSCCVTSGQGKPETLICSVNACLYATQPWMWEASGLPGAYKIHSFAKKKNTGLLGFLKLCIDKTATKSINIFIV